MPQQYVIVVSHECHIAGNKRHGTIYPMFSRFPAIRSVSGGENCVETVLRRITIEDGRFKNASRSVGYTGQHTDLIPDGRAQIESVRGGTIITSRSPYIYFCGYSRNKYGGRNFSGRLDCDRGVCQRSITRGDKTTWHDFSPSQYID